MQVRNICFYVFEGFADWEAAYALAGLNSLQMQRDPGRFCVRTFADSLAPVRSMGGVTVMPDATLSDCNLEQSAMLVLPGGQAWEAGGNENAIHMAKRFLAAGIPVAAICGATYGLARAGMLDERKHTSNAAEYLAASGYAGAAAYQCGLAVTDGGLITAAGTASLEFAREIFMYLDLYTEPVLEAWYQLFKTGDAGGFGKLMQALQPI